MLEKADGITGYNCLSDNSVIDIQTRLKCLHAVSVHASELPAKSDPRPVPAAELWQGMALETTSWFWPNSCQRTL